jgi:hypothetical protein
MLHRGITVIRLSSGNKLLLCGRPDVCWLVVDAEYNLIGEFQKAHGHAVEIMQPTSLAKLSGNGISVSGVLGMAIIDKLELADVTPYLESRAGKYVP